MNLPHNYGVTDGGGISHMHSSKYNNQLIMQDQCGINCSIVIIIIIYYVYVKSVATKLNAKVSLISVKCIAIIIDLF